MRLCDLTGSSGLMTRFRRLERQLLSVTLSFLCIVANGRFPTSVSMAPHADGWGRASFLRLEPATHRASLHWPELRSRNATFCQSLAAEEGAAA